MLTAAVGNISGAPLKTRPNKFCTPGYGAYYDHACVWL